MNDDLTFELSTCPETRIFAKCLGMGIQIESKVFSRTSSLEQHPMAEVFVDPGYVLTGGGAWIDYEEPGNLLTQSSPVLGPEGAWSGWAAQGKDAWVASKARITVYAIGIKITKDGYPVDIEQTVIVTKGDKAELPKTPDYEGWIGVGGGTKCEQNIFENVVITESAPFRGKPDTESDLKVLAWYGSMHYCYSPTSNRGPTGGGSLETYLVVIRAAGIPLTTRIHSEKGEISPRPEAEVFAAGQLVVSGGAYDKQSDVGITEMGGNTVNILTAACPIYNEESPTQITGWKAAGKEHHYRSPSKVRAYAVTLCLEE